MASAVVTKICRAAVLTAMLGLAFTVHGEKMPQVAKTVEGSAKSDQQGASCVEPTEWMRRNHMEFIQHQRDLTVRQGVRVEKDSLANCVDCHARYDSSHQPVAINAEGEFCASCHNYTAVNITCFQCHSKVPATETAQR